MTPTLSRTGTAPPSAVGWLLALGYIAVFVVLDWVSYIRPYQGLNITPWNPQPALAIALLLQRPRSLPLVWAGLLAAEAVVRGLPDDLLVVIAATSALALSYAAIARGLATTIMASPVLGHRRALGWLTVWVIGGSLLGSVFYLGTLTVGGLGASGSAAQAIIRFWIGDAVGLLVTLPMLLVLLDPGRRSEARGLLRLPLSWLIGLLALLLLVLVFTRDGHDQFKFFYLLFLPVVWAAARLGLSGAVLASALTQAGLIVAARIGANPDLTVFELQVLMAALSTTGLLIAVTVDERRRAEAELRGSLRLAAAGQMAAALAHELSQPLTALNSYAEITRMLAADTALSAEERLRRLTEVTGRMADDALRATDVVKRLRDFFRTGHTQLRSTALEPLLHDAIDAARNRATMQRISLDADIRPLTDVLIDPVQIGVVLRNLLANALDAATGDGRPGWVRLLASADDDELRVEVRDSGPGIDAARLPALFEPGASEKPSGMGIGLSICRAIVEAHGGRLWAEAGPSGIFCLTLPIGRPLPPLDHAS